MQRHVARDLLARVRGAHLPLSQAELDRGVAAAAGTPVTGGATTEGGAETRNDVPRDEPSGDETPYRDESRALDREDRDVEDRDARDGEADDDEDHE